jgi:RHS repeat-associated protein
LLIYLVALSHGTDAPLHALVQGTSCSGKTHLITKISELLPTEDVITLTRVTDSSFYNYGRQDLQNKLIVLEDLDGLKEDALLAFCELQSRGRLTSSTSIKDENGNIRGVVRTVEGPVASLAATTRGEVYEDNLSRCLIVAVDETEVQTKAVIDYQNRRAAGLIDIDEERQLRTFLRGCARLLDRSKTVVNPYATAIQLPAEASKLRRLNALYQSFVRQIVLLHQYQDGEIRYYLDGLEVFKDKPASYSFAEGRLAFRDGEAHFQYRIADHLGNTVVLFEDKNDDGLITDNPNDPEASEVLQRKLYYPFGMELRGTSPVRPVVAQRYRYNGIERNDDLGLDMAFFRTYDPAIGRWLQVDPKAESFATMSPYTGMGNNPISIVDPMGDSLELIIGEAYTDANGVLHEYGHVALRVFNSKEGYDYVFDFGRYARTWRLGMHGDGVLNVHTDGEEYIDYQQGFRDSQGFSFETTAAEDKQVLDHFEGLTTSGEKRKNGVPGGGKGKSFILDDNYRVKSNNCCTMSLGGMEQIGLDFASGEYDPRALLPRMNNDRLGSASDGMFKVTKYHKGGKTKGVWQVPRTGRGFPRRKL